MVSGYLGDDAEGMKRLEAAIAKNVKDTDFLYRAAGAYRSFDRASVNPYKS